MPEDTEPSLIVALYGPTSSGKTSLSVQTALRVEQQLGRKAIIISADSRQVYRYMDIGTSKTTAAEMRGIEHTLLDILEPTRKLELEEYISLAREEISKAAAAGAVPFVVGGTGVYVSALMEGWEVEDTGAARTSLRRDFPPSMLPDAHAMLTRLDRGTAGRVHPNNYEAVINALARVMTGAAPQRSDSSSRTLVLGLDPGQRIVDQRVARTYDEQLRRGLLDEITALNDRYGLGDEIRSRGRGSRNQVLHTHGYREFFDVALRDGKQVAALSEDELEDVREEILQHIRAYTRRQRSWFKKLRPQRMINSPEQAFREISRHFPSAASK